MGHRTLVAYASRAGSTADVAGVIGEVLRERGLDVDVRSVKDVSDVSGYDSLVLGTAIWAGKPLPEMQRFLANDDSALAHLPVAYFILCEILRESTPSNRQIALGYLTSMRAYKEPVAAGMFAGRRDLSTTNPLLRWLLLHVVKLAEGDWRNWDQIRAWAAALAPQLSRRAPARVGVGAA